MHSYHEARAHNQELLRRNVIDAASRLLTQEGAQALTVRRIAQELQCSTKVIYTMFQSKEGLADALYQEGSLLMQQTIARVPQYEDPVRTLHEMALLYWRFATEYPGYYMLMFCGTIPGFTPSEESIAMTNNAFDTLVQIIEKYMQLGALPEGDPIVLMKAFWAALHGVLSLHLLGHFSPKEMSEQVFSYMVQAMISSLLSQPVV